MTYARAFFDLQLDFALKVSALSGLPLARTALDYTNFYIRFGLGRDFDPAHPVWREYAAGLEALDPREWTYRFYSTRARPVTVPALVATFGCFAYARPTPERIRLHFQNTEAGGHAPLAMDRRDRRVADLTALFSHVKGTAGQPLRVAGVSWLYNVDAYRRLFPPSYVATARPAGDRFRNMPLWGQFVNRRGEIREREAEQFRERLARQPDLESLSRCFPLLPLAVEAPAAEFYDFYGI